MNFNFIDEKLARLMKKSGCLFVKSGIESCDDTILKNMNKPSRVKDYVRAVRALVKYNISMVAFFIVGFPGETKETIENTINAMNSFPCTEQSIHNFLFQPTR